MDKHRQSLMNQAAAYAAQYLSEIDNRPVFPSQATRDRLTEFDFDLPDNGRSDEELLELLHTVGSPATVASAGHRYFGFVTGGSLPVTLASKWLATAWDQNSFSETSSPVGAKIEAVALRWLCELLHLPGDSGGALVTGATLANFCCLAAARSRLLAAAGWDVDASGLFGAPEIPVIVGTEVHATVSKSLSLLGFGRDRVTVVPTDDNGRMQFDQFPKIEKPALIILQAGNVNSGDFDPINDICEHTKGTGSWVHVDGAFGLWAAASEKYRHLVRGLEKADSWAVDGHKWLNVPYDCGIAIVREGDWLKKAMAMSAAYLMQSGASRQPIDFGPEGSRRPRGIEVWAALASLGREGVAALVERCCRHASIAAGLLHEGGCDVLNDIVLNQVLVSFGDDDRTRAVTRAVQDDGTCWCGGTEWKGRTAMRISFSSWATQDEDVERSVAAIIRLARSNDQ